ncbi:putative apolipoprotein D [Penaeus vannamei]|uniref:Putative apolipoprotein D n=1 Tax=Penaeus vannamei TaxID=6689 RepID=A0A3R7MPG2_PENVA|nr:putative apolipoprotein D [Penaeus vannamei]
MSGNFTVPDRSTFCPTVFARTASQNLHGGRSDGDVIAGDRKRVSLTNAVRFSLQRSLNSLNTILEHFALSNVTRKIKQSRTRTPTRTKEAGTPRPPARPPGNPLLTNTWKLRQVISWSNGARKTASGFHNGEEKLTTRAHGDEEEEELRETRTSSRLCLEQEREPEVAPPRWNQKNETTDCVRGRGRAGGGAGAHTLHLGRTCPNVQPFPNLSLDKVLGAWYVVHKFDTDNTCLMWNLTRGELPDTLLVTETRQLSVLDTFGVDHTHAITAKVDIPNPEVPSKMRIRWPTCRCFASV